MASEAKFFNFNKIQPSNWSGRSTFYRVFIFENSVLYKYTSFFILFVLLFSHLHHHYLLLTSSYDFYASSHFVLGCQMQPYRLVCEPILCTSVLLVFNFSTACCSLLLQCYVVWNTISPA